MDENIEKVIAPPVKAMFVSFLLAWGLLFVPFPPVNYFIAAPLLFTGMVLAIICLAKNAILPGVVWLLFSFIVTPIIFLLSIGMFLSLISDVFKQEKPIKVIREQVKERVIEGSIVTAPPREEVPPPPKYKHMITLNNGKTIIADSIQVDGNTVIYKEGSIKVTVKKSDIKSYRKIEIKR